MKTAIVLCAGIGSRMGLPKDVNKCATPICDSSAVRHNVAALISIGFLNIIVVVGYAESSVQNALKNISNGSIIKYIKNDKFDFHGCNYSIAYGVSSIEKGTKQLLIVEGDSLLHIDSVRQISSSSDIAASLVRSKDYIDPSRSVIAIGSDNLITRYYYDQQHTGTLPKLKDGEVIIGDSMQLWSFSGDIITELQTLLHEYKEQADNSSTPMMESGIYSINKLTSSITPVYSTKPDKWINLNTKGDLRKAGRLDWLLK